MCCFAMTFSIARPCSPNLSLRSIIFGLALILNVAFVQLYHINEIGRRAGDVMSYASLFVGREKSISVVPSVMKGQVLHLFL